MSSFTHVDSLMAKKCPDLTRLRPRPGEFLKRIPHLYLNSTPLHLTTYVFYVKIHGHRGAKGRAQALGPLGPKGPWAHGPGPMGPGPGPQGPRGGGRAAGLITIPGLCGHPARPLGPGPRGPRARARPLAPLWPCIFTKKRRCFT